MLGTHSTDGGARMLERAGKDLPAGSRDLSLWDSNMALTPRMRDEAQHSTPRPCSDRSLQRLAICYSLLPAPCSQEAVRTGGSDLGSGARDKPKATRP